MDELLREIERLKQENQDLRDLLQQVTERLVAAEETIKQLRQQLGQNSRNSNWPSSRSLPPVFGGLHVLVQRCQLKVFPVKNSKF